MTEAAALLWRSCSLAADEHQPERCKSRRAGFYETDSGLAEALNAKLELPGMFGPHQSLTQQYATTV